MDASLDIWIEIHYAVEVEPLYALKNGGIVTVRHLYGLEDFSKCTEFVQIFFARFFDVYVKLRDRSYEQSVRLGFLYQFDGLRSSYGQRKYGVREDDGSSKCQYGNDFRKILLFYIKWNVPLDDRDYTNLCRCFS